MSNEFPCSQCGRLLQGGGAAGTKILCPGCGAFAAVPEGPPQPSAAAGEPIEFRCTGCNRLLRTPADTAGKQAKCPDCGTILPVPMPGTADVGSVPPPPPPTGAAGSSFEPGCPPPVPDSPFASQGPSAEGAGENPYQAPTRYGETPAEAYGTTESLAASRVSGPAIALIVVASLGLAISVFGLLFMLLGAGIEMADGREPLPMIMLTGGLGVVFRLLAMVACAVVIVGALKMRRLEKFSLAMAASILVMIPGLSPCCCVGLPFGIWSLVVLNDPGVKAAFRG